MRFVKGSQDSHEFGIRLFLDPNILGARSFEFVFSKWYVGIEW